jgi:hypothetical protein
MQMEHRNYADYADVMKAVLDYRKHRGLQDYEVVSLHLHGESLTTWMVGYRKDDHTVRVSVNIKPNAHVPGWHAETHEFWGVQDVEGIIKGYPVEFLKLHQAFPDAEIMFLDNEDDANYAFGYAALRNVAGNWRIVGWVQATMDNAEDNAYIANPKLPFHELVTDRDILDALNDELLEYALRNR